MEEGMRVRMDGSRGPRNVGMGMGMGMGIILMDIRYKVEKDVEKRKRKRKRKRKKFAQNIIKGVLYGEAQKDEAEEVCG